MSSIRIHLGPMSRMLRAMIQDLLSAEPDMIIVGHSYAPKDGLPAASALGADILIAQERPTAPDDGTAAVLSGAPAAILSVATDGRSGTSVNLVRQPVCLNGGVSFPDAIRGVLDRPSGAVRSHD
jgi:hypothetical protein